MTENPNYEKLKQKLQKLEKNGAKEKQAQKMLKRKITELDSFINNIPDMAWIKDENSRFITVNRAFGEAVGWGQDALIDQTCEICFGKEGAKKFRDDDLKVMKGKRQEVIEEKIIDSQHKAVWLETVKSPILDNSGKAIGTVGISRDISKRKRAEEKLRRAHDDLERIVKERTAELEQANAQLRLEIEERKKAQKEASYEQSLMQTLLNNIPDYVYFKDKNRRFVSASNFFCDLFGCNMEDIIGKKDEDLFPEEIAEETSSDDRHVIETGIPLVNKEEGGESVGEGGQWVLTTKLPWCDDRGNVIGLFGISRDITDRKRAEEAVRKSAERYALATKAARVGVWDWNIQTNEFYLDPNVKAILGYGDAEIPNDIEVWSNYVYPDDKQPVMEAFQDHIDGKTPEFAYKHRMLHKDGSIRWIIARGTVIRDDQGNPVRVVGTDIDITQYQQAEEALREKDNKLERQAKNLIEMNTALKVLLEQREKEKTEIKENLVTDIKKLVYPYIEKLENMNLNQDAQTFVDIIKSNINDLISPFAETLSSKYFALTPSEIQIADLIKHGRTSKEIASILNVSPKAVSFHRGNLRKKLGLLNKKINLRTYLQTFPH